MAFKMTCFNKYMSMANRSKVLLLAKLAHVVIMEDGLEP